MDLTTIELAAIRGMQALGREMQARHADEVRQHGVTTLQVLADIAQAHGLPADAFHADWGIVTETGQIVRLSGTTPAEVAP